MVDKRVPVSLACELCGARNYRTTRAKTQNARVLELKKYCDHCKKHTVHKETK